MKSFSDCPLARWVREYGHDGGSDYLRDMNGHPLPNVRCAKHGRAECMADECRHGIGHDRVT